MAMKTGSLPPLTINLPEQEAHENYIGKRFNIGIDTDHMMKCWKVETLRVEK